MTQSSQQSPPSPANPDFTPKPSKDGMTAGGGAPDLSQLSPRMKDHPGKRWGELPGELRTRIVQDLRGRYGDEYGPIIQRYFQQIADVPAVKKSK